MGALEAVLAFIGSVALAVVIARQLWYVPDQALEDDPAAPYCEALEAATRMQRMAQELQQEIRDEPIRHAETPGAPTGIRFPEPPRRVSFPKPEF
jgi:hypothetical protein